MRSSVLYNAFRAEVTRMRRTEREIVSFLPVLIRAVDYAPLADLVTRQREEAQRLLGILTRMKCEERGGGSSKDLQKLLLAGAQLAKAEKKGAARDRRITAFVEKIISLEIECCSCLISMAAKLGYEEEAESMHKNLRKKEALEKNLNACKQKFHGGRAAAEERGGADIKAARLKRV